MWLTPWKISEFRGVSSNFSKTIPEKMCIMMEERDDQAMRVSAFPNILDGPVWCSLNLS